MRRLTICLVLAGCPNAVPEAQKFAPYDAMAAADSGAFADASSTDTAGVDAATADVPVVDLPDVPATDAAPDVPADVPPADAGCAKNGCPDGNPCEIATCGGDGVCSSVAKGDGSGCGGGHTCYSGICLPDPPKIVQIALSGDTSCARLGDGTVRCWGRGHDGQLGNGKSSNGYFSATPVVVAGVTGATDLACGENHCCAVATGGKVYCWGANDQGQSSPTAAKIVQAKAIEVAGVTAVKIAVGDYHTCVLAAAGKVRCWGLGTVGQLGDGNANVPGKVVDVAWNGYATDIRAGTHHTCARSAQGQVFCWGDNSYGQIGDGQGGTSKEADVPALVGGLAEVTTLGLGEQHSCAVVKIGDVLCWGHQSSYELGSGGQNSYYSTPQLAAVGGAVQVAAGGAHTCAVIGGATVSCWGANQRGQTGQGVTQVTKDPTVVPDFDGIASVAAGGEHTCALGLDGGVWCWGANDSGQCGSAGKTVLVPGKVGF